MEPPKPSPHAANRIASPLGVGEANDLGIVAEAAQDLPELVVLPEPIDGASSCCEWLMVGAGWWVVDGDNVVGSDWLLMVVTVVASL